MQIRNVKDQFQINESDLIPPFEYDVLTRPKTNYRMHRIKNANHEVLVTVASEAMAKLIVHALNVTYPAKEQASCVASETKEPA